MNIEIRQHTFNLAGEGLLAIRDGQSTRIRCLNGSVWITEEGQTRDTILERDESYTLRRAGLAVITALGASRIALEGPMQQGSTLQPSAGDVPELASCA